MATSQGSRVGGACLSPSATSFTPARRALVRYNAILGQRYAVNGAIAIITGYLPTSTRQELDDMLSNADLEKARELKARISVEIPVSDLIAYGSRARGHASDESDLDVFIVMDSVTPSLRRRICEIAWEGGFAHARLISTIVATHAQLAGALGASSLVRNIRLEGVHT